MGEASTDDDLLLKNFFAEVSEVERDNEVLRFFSLSLSLYNCIWLYAELMNFVFFLFLEFLANR